MGWGFVFGVCAFLFFVVLFSLFGVRCVASRCVVLRCVLCLGSLVCGVLFLVLVLGVLRRGSLFGAFALDF